MISDDEFLKLLENYQYSYTFGKIINGRIVGYEGNSLLVDINAKSCAICPLNEILIFKNENIKEKFKVGLEYEFLINSQENEDGIYYLSHKKVAMQKNIEILHEIFKNNEAVKGTIVNKIKGGVIVSVLGVRGFVPASQLKDDEEIGKNIDLKILAIDIPQGNFILSNKKIYEEVTENIKKEIFDKIELNMVVKGKVVRIAEFGAFVDIGGVDGLLPLSQISWNWVDNPQDLLKLGETIDVEIIGIDKEKQRLTLSLKSLESNPWLEVQGVIKEQDKIKGKVTRIKPFGAFIEIYPKVEGLLSKKQMQQYCLKYQKELVESCEIDVFIKKLDIQNQKIVLEII